MSFTLGLLFSILLLLLESEEDFCQKMDKYDVKDDDYYESFYLRKIPKLKVSPDKVKQFFVNHLSWFPSGALYEEADGMRNHRHLTHMRRSKLATVKENGCETSRVEKIKQTMKNFTEQHLGIRANLTALKNNTEKLVKPMKDYLNKMDMKGKLKNMTHSMRIRNESTTSLRPTLTSFHFFITSTEDPCKRNFKCGMFGPTIRIHRKIDSGPSFHRKGRLAGVRPPRQRKIRIFIDVDKNPKHENAVNLNNSSHVLVTAEEMATDLAGRVTNLWKCMVGLHRSPDFSDVKYYLYTRRNVIRPEILRVNYDLIKNKTFGAKKADVKCVDLKPADIEGFERISDDNRKIIKSNFLSIKAPTKILIHGYTGSYRDSRMVKIKDAYLSSGRFNVIQVDWETLAAPPCYIRVTHHSRFVGETVAKFVDGLYLIGLNMSLVHIVGFSLGAQVAGFTGNKVVTSNICRITGLDPALPLFLNTDSSGHLDKYDADFVDVIHTCGGILAILDPIGHIDFYPNGGSRQPGCEFSNLKCSHSRAPRYFAESIVPKRNFIGHLCESWEEYVSGLCNSSVATSLMGEPCSKRYPTLQDIDGKKEELFHSQKNSCFDEKLKFSLDYHRPSPNLAKSECDFHSMNSNESIGKNEYENSRTELSDSSESHTEEKTSSEPSDTVKGPEHLGIVKSILGPSFEDAVLRTLEFGKSLLQKGEISEAEVRKGRRHKGRKQARERKKSMTFGEITGDGDKIERAILRKEQRNARKTGIVRKTDKDVLSLRKVTDLQYLRPTSLVKIRSLDSELKQIAPSPEKIKRQLEALIQINKDDFPECGDPWGCFYSSKEFRPMKPRLQYTVMPATVCSPACPLPKDDECSCVPDRFAGDEKCSKRANSNGGSSSSKARPCEAKSKKMDFRQAPEYISTALGPTLDISILDNLKIMRNLFEYEKKEKNERGEPCEFRQSPEAACPKTKSSLCSQCKQIEDLQKMIEDLTAKRERLCKDIEVEECKREAKRKAHEEEEKKLQSVKACLKEMMEEEKTMQLHKKQSLSECRDYEQKFQALKCRIKSEEERLNCLKEQSEKYKKEIMDVKMKKESLKRNKSLIDAWDMIASKACHTRLISYSRVQCLERKDLKGTKDHCCTPKRSCEKSETSVRPVISKSSCILKAFKSRSKSLECNANRLKRRSSKPECEQFAHSMQRDIVCGLHKNIEPCLCSYHNQKENSFCSSDDENRKITKKGKPVQRSKSDTGCHLYRAKLCKVLWAVTRINVFQDSSRTYEVMDATTVPPKCPPCKTEGVFVVKASKCCPEPPRKVCPQFQTKCCNDPPRRPCLELPKKFC